MNLCHTAALALVGWYLMTPPNHDAPVSQWNLTRSFDSAAECEAFKQAGQEEIQREEQEGAKKFKAASRTKTHAAQRHRG